MLFDLSRKRLRSFALTAFGLIAVGASAQTTTTGGLPDEGVLRLQLGDVDRLTWVTPSTTDVDIYQTIHDLRDLTGRARDKCILAVIPDEKPPNLVKFTAGVPTSNQPGIFGDSIGVFSGGSGTAARGVDCGRAGVNESLTLKLASAVSGRVARRAELDVEVKQNARIRAIARLGANISSTWELRSGGGIVPGEGSSTPGDPIFNCSAVSDSGPDAGAADNCRWVIDGVWDSLELVTLAGEWSLEGGSDWGGQANANRTDIYLTRASGILDCGASTITAGDGTVSASITGLRLPNATGTACVPIPYLLDATENSVRFEKDLFGQTDAAIIFTIEWLQEAAVFPIAPTVQFFGASTTPVPIGLCVGTPNPGGDPFNTTDLDITAFVPSAIDQDPTLPDIQYGCLLSETTDYVGTDLIKVTQLIYLRGDWAANR
jgi:hypothetical protein